MKFRSLIVTHCRHSATMDLEVELKRTLVVGKDFTQHTAQINTDSSNLSS